VFRAAPSIRKVERLLKSEMDENGIGFVLRKYCGHLKWLKHGKRDLR